MKVVLAHDFGGDGFVVWAMLDDPDYNGEPQDRGESFVIGQGATPAEAVDAAIRDLKRAWEDTEALRVSAITDQQIELLQAEAGAAGDEGMVATCERARDGDETARAECARVIEYTAAQRDGGSA